MKKIIMKLLLILSIFGLNLVNVFGITLQVPTPSGQDDIVVTGPTQVESNESTIFDIIQIVNDYLRFAIAGIAMVVLIYGGIKLITSDRNKEEVSKVNKMIVSAMIAIFAAIISYAIVKLVVNIF